MTTNRPIAICITTNICRFQGRLTQFHTYSGCLSQMQNLFPHYLDSLIYTRIMQVAVVGVCSDLHEKRRRSKNLTPESITLSVIVCISCFFSDSIKELVICHLLASVNKTAVTLPWNLLFMQFIFLAFCIFNTKNGMDLPTS